MARTIADLAIPKFTSSAPRERPCLRKRPLNSQRIHHSPIRRCCENHYRGGQIRQKCSAISFAYWDDFHSLGTLHPPEARSRRCNTGFGKRRILYFSLRSVALMPVQGDCVTALSAAPCHAERRRGCERTVSPVLGSGENISGEMYRAIGGRIVLL